MSYKTELSRYIKADVWRVHGCAPTGAALKLVLMDPAFRVLFSYRLCRYLESRGSLWRIAYWLARFWHRRNQFAMGLEIPVSSEIGPGLRIHHGWSTVINDQVKIGSNVTLLHSVTLGGTRNGAPVVEDGATLAVGAIVVGPITIGRGAIVGAGAVVTKDVPAHSIVAGNPARVLQQPHAREPLNVCPLDEWR